MKSTNQVSSFGLALCLIEDQKELITKTAAFFQDILCRRMYTHTMFRISDICWGHTNCTGRGSVGETMQNRDLIHNLQSKCPTFLAKAGSCQSRYAPLQTRSTAGSPSGNIWQFHWELKPIAIQQVLGFWIANSPYSHFSGSTCLGKNILSMWTFFSFRESRRGDFSLQHFLKNNSVHVLKAPPSL